jgi:hypothetical protein
MEYSLNSIKTDVLGVATVSIDASPVVLHGIALGPAVVIRDCVSCERRICGSIYYGYHLNKF